MAQLRLRRLRAMLSNTFSDDCMVPIWPSARYLTRQRLYDLAPRLKRHIAANCSRAYSIVSLLDVIVHVPLFKRSPEVINFCDNQGTLSYING